MNKRDAFLISLLCFLSLPLAACRAEVVESPPTPNPTPRPSLLPPASPTPPLSAAVHPTQPITPTAATSEPQPQPAEQVLVEHTVQAGDTLLEIAMLYDVPMAAIQLQNGLGDSTVVQVGQILAIPPSTGWEGASRFWVVHIVQPGETVVGIARTFGLEAEQVKNVNGLTDADLIVVGQALVLPLDGPAIARAPDPTDPPAPSPTAAPPTTPPPTQADAPTPAPAAPPPANVADWPRETVRLINQVRAEHGLAPLLYDETLARAAQAQANDCAQRGWCSHVGSDGSDIKARILRAGYDPATWAECWAQRQTPQGAVDIWMDEVPPNDPHRRTLLATWLPEIGVGVAETTWGYYFIADFGRPKGG